MLLSDADASFVSALAVKAGRLAVELRPSIAISVKSAPDDRVTSADIALSTLITGALKERFEGDCVVSEEDSEHLFAGASRRVWLIDPIDGTQNYINGDGDYCVMIGLLLDGRPHSGWVYAPTTDRLYQGGLERPTTVSRPGETSPTVCRPDQITVNHLVRLVIGTRDRRANPWLSELEDEMQESPGVRRAVLMKTGSIGLKVAKILDGEADIFAHLSGKLKTWDTAGPAALALGAGLDVGKLDGELTYSLPSVVHEGSVIMGRPGALTWCRQHLSARVHATRQRKTNA